MRESDNRYGAGLTRSRPIPHDLKIAIDYLRQNIARKLSTADLADHCDVAERTLSKHFREFLGLPPIRYLQRLRLTAARDMLIRGEKVSVSEVARRCGFTHFGRFSEQYRKCFGESPSTTLSRGRTAILERITSDERDQAGQRRDWQAPLTHTLRDKPSIAILPCQTAASEPTHRLFADSVAEGLAAALCAVRSLTVMVPRSPRAAARDPQRLARELGGRYFLTGKIIHAGTRLRLVVGLVEAANGQHVWGDSYEGERDALLALQDRVIAGVTRAILPRIRGSEIDRARRTHIGDLDAYGLAMRALPFVFDATRRALELLNRAIEIDPDYGLATGLAAWCHGQLVMNNATGLPAEERMRALRLAERAAVLAPDDPLVLTARCAVHTMAHEFDAAETLVARALALDPTSAWSWGRRGWVYAYRGHSDVAIEHFRRAISLDPRSSSKANSFVGLGGAHFDAGRYEAAAFWMRKALLEQPGTLWANRTLSASYDRIGEHLKATKSMEALRRYCPDLTVGRVVTSIPFRPDFLDRLGNGLSALGLPA